MRVLFLTTNYPRVESPLDGVFVREHARAASDVADVRVVHLERARGRTILDIEGIGGEEPPAWRVRYRRFGKPVSPAAFLLAPVVATRRLARRGWKPDVIHAHSFLSALPALELGTLLRCPVAYTEHWTIFLPENPARLSAPMRLAARLALSRADVVLPVSAVLGEALRRIAPRAHLRVIPNVVDETLFYPGEGEREDEVTRLLTAGLLDTDRKGIDILLEALARLPHDRRVVLDIVGDGSNRPGYEQLARELGLAGNVTFHGLKPKGELAELMRRADLFVLGSRYENNPCVVIEALASGLPVVATRVGGMPELVDGSNGLLADPQDPTDLAERLTEALDRLPAFDRTRIAEDALDRYGRKTIGRALLDAYEGCLRR